MKGHPKHWKQTSKNNAHTLLFNNLRFDIQWTDLTGHQGQLCTLQSTANVTYSSKQNTLTFNMLDSCVIYLHTWTNACKFLTYVLTDEAAIYSKILMEHNLRPVWSDVRIKSSPILYTICTNTFLLRECFSNCVKSSTNIWASFKNRPIRSHCLRHINFICRASHVIDFCN